MRRLTVFGLVFLLISGVWCGGFAGDAAAMLAEMRSKPMPECAQHGMSSENEGSQGAGIPCAFRSLDLLSQGASSSLRADNIFNYGHFVPLSLSEKKALTSHFRVVPESLAAKSFPCLFYSVLNL
jgi:hypothetical protein